MQLNMQANDDLVYNNIIKAKGSVLPFSINIK